MKAFGNFCFLVACGLAYTATRHPGLVPVCVGLVIVWGLCTVSGPKN